MSQANISTVNIKCPVAGCAYETGLQEPIVAAALLQLHGTEHAQNGGGRVSTSRPPPVDRPKLNTN